ncbi:CbaC protein [Halorussus salilacus]|uniref:CbaC protein n=1 Tax=Halorussus salilacus TaxID=2953750 RepID=UPI0020A21805|nr:CbaC protein [Halorussus salilacus]USZ69427.1 CbaC protein [Halorussus salilacus]
MRLTKAGVLILVAFSVPVAIELRTLFALFGIDLPLAAAGVFEVVLLVAILSAYVLGERRAAATGG